MLEEWFSPLLAFLGIGLVPLLLIILIIVFLIKS